MRQSPSAIAGRRPLPPGGLRTRAPARSLPSFSRAACVDGVAMRTTTCGRLTRCGSIRWRARVISANGSRAISSGASLPATATATSTASVLEPRLDAVEPAIELSMPSAMTAEAAATRSVGVAAAPSLRPRQNRCDRRPIRRRRAGVRLGQRDRRLAAGWRSPRRTDIWRSLS